MLDNACVYDKLQVTIGKKTLEEHRGVTYQTKRKELLYTSVQHELTIRDSNQKRCYSCVVDIIGLKLVGCPEKLRE